MIGNHRAKGKILGNKNALGNKLSKETRERMGVARKGNVNNGKVFIRCIETNEVYRTREWILKGYKNAYLVAQHKRNVCKGKHFEYETVM